MIVKNDHRRLIFQFKQLERRSLKKIRASTGFEPVTSAIPVRCSTNWAMKPLTLGARSIYWVHFSREEWHDVKFIWNNFFRLLLSNCLNWKINCDDHSSLLLKYYWWPTQLKNHTLWGCTYLNISRIREWPPPRGGMSCSLTFSYLK